MSKTITITDIDLKEMLITSDGSDIKVNLYYSLLDASANQVDHKRITLTNSDMTAAQLTKINDIISAVETKIKQKENI